MAFPTLPTTLLASTDVRPLTWVVELGVGLACALAAFVATRRGARTAGVLLAIAGAAATIHAAGALAGVWG